MCIYTHACIHMYIYIYIYMYSIIVIMIIRPDGMVQERLHQVALEAVYVDDDDVLG